MLCGDAAGNISAFECCSAALWLSAQCLMFTRAGLCLIPGSHKGNYRCPVPISRGVENTEMVKQMSCKAGDCVIFTEA